MRYLAIGLIVLLAAGIWGYQKFYRSPAAPAGAAAAAAPATAAAAAPAAPAAKPGASTGGGGAMPVEAEVVKAETIAQEIIAVGSLRSNESVTLSSEIAGRIAGIHFKEGLPVAKGTLLFELDDSILRAEREQARAGLALSEANHKRAEELFVRNLVSARERDEAASKLDVDRANVALADARLAKTRIRAPFEGIVGLRAVSPGDYVTAGQALAPLEQVSVLKVDFRLSEVALSAIKVGQALNLEVDAYPGKVFTGRVYAIDPRLAEATRSIGVRARVPNDKSELRPGLFARVRLVIAERGEAVLVPEQSIVPQGEKLFVYVIEDGKAAMRAVELGVRQAGRVEVTSGVKPGDVVITAGVQKIGPGAPVMAINLGPPPG
jgi:membrane fusion protein (multidrug efflux system)